MNAGGSATTTCTVLQPTAPDYPKNVVKLGTVLARTWNVFHGNADPPERRAFLEEMIRLVTADRPDVVCLQELPVWSLSRLPLWSGMTSVGDVATRPTLGPVPSTAEVGRVLTNLHHGFLRSAFSGQANALLVGATHDVVEHRRLVLNPWSFRRYEGRRLGLVKTARRKWARERRVCQVVRLSRAGSTLVVANLHASGARDTRIPGAELLRAATFVDGFALPGEAVVLAGDFNVTPDDSDVLRDLLSPAWSFGGATPSGIDHVLVRGRDAGEPFRWPVARRLVEGRVLSDHAPVERSLA